MAYQTIVVGTDGSETATKAVDHAATLAAATSGRLVIATAFERSDNVPDDRIPEEVRWQLTDANAAERQVHAARDRAGEIGVTDIVVQAVPGEAPDVLIDAAKEFGADVLVVGSIGLTGALRILGSVASAVLHHAPCDVLVVRTN